MIYSYGLLPCHFYFWLTIAVLMQYIAFSQSLFLQLQLTPIAR